MAQTAFGSSSARRYYAGMARLLERLASLPGVDEGDSEFSGQLAEIAHRIRDEITQIN